MFPLDKVKRLSDFGGDFVLSVLCTNPICQHERVLAAHSLAQRYGSEARVVDLVRRMRCTKCRGRKVDVMVAGIPR